MQCFLKVLTRHRWKRQPKPSGRGGEIPAEIYDALFVPALFQQWGPVVAGEARIGRGDQGDRRRLRNRCAGAAALIASGRRARWSVSTPMPTCLA